MSKTPLLLALLSLLAPATVLVAGPPQGPSGRLVQDPVPELQAEVKRLEKVVAENPRILGLVEELTVARARLAAARGEVGEARAAWQRVIAAREEAVAFWEALKTRGMLLTPNDPAIIRGPVAEARCELAEVERDQAVLARELPKVITYREAQLALLRSRAEAGIRSREQLEQGEKALLKEIRQARQRLDAVKRR